MLQRILSVFLLPFLIHGTFPLSVTRTLPTPNDAVCYNLDGVNLEGIIPHDTNCNYFVQCVEFSTGYSYGITRNCQPNLFFSLVTCQCEHRPDDCFDPGDPNSVMLQYNCVVEMIQNDGSELS